MKLARIAVVLIALIVSLPVCFAQSVSLTYDANGNLITGDGKFRTYNDLNQLTDVRNGSNSTAPLLERYEYHPVEERIWLKDVYDAGVYKETIFYDNEQFVQTQNSSSNYSTLYVKHEGSLVAQQTASTTDYLVSDPYGAYALVTNEFGTVIENTSMEPFGRIISGGERTRFDYEDREYSSITGDYDFRFRKYDPNLKIFTQPDTIVPNPYDPQKLNRYAFERGNPYRYNDPTGHYEEDVHHDLTAYLAVAAGYSESDAEVIADADQGADDNFFTSPFNPFSTKKYHFQTRDSAESGVEKAVASKNLKSIGKSLHTLQDSYSHEGYDFNPSKREFGHVSAKHVPDKTYFNSQKANVAAFATFAYLAKSKGMSNKELLDTWAKIEKQVSKFNAANNAVDKKKALNPNIPGTTKQTSPLKRPSIKK